MSTTFGTSAGTQDFDSVDAADVIMIIGANPTDAHPVFASHMKRTAARRARELIIVDPRRIDLVKSPHVQADYHLPLLPGTNVAMINALAHVIVTEGLVDEALREGALRSGGLRAVAQIRRGRAQFARSHGSSLPAFPPRMFAPPRGFTPPAATPRFITDLGVTEHSQGSTMVMGMATWPWPPATSARTAWASIRCADKTTCKAPATWVRSRTNSPVTAMCPSTPCATSV